MDGGTKERHLLLAQVVRREGTSQPTSTSQLNIYVFPHLDIENFSACELSLAQILITKPLQKKHSKKTNVCSHLAFKT